MLTSSTPPAAPPQAPTFNSLLAETWSTLALAAAQPFLATLLANAFKDFVDFSPDAIDVEVLAAPTLTFVNTPGNPNEETITLTIGTTAQPWRIRAQGTTKSKTFDKFVKINGGLFVGLTLTVPGLTLTFVVDHSPSASAKLPQLKDIKLDVKGFSVAVEGALAGLKVTISAGSDNAVQKVQLAFDGKLDNLLSNVTGGVFTQFQAKGMATLSLVGSSTTVAITKLQLDGVKVVPDKTGHQPVSLDLGPIPFLAALKTGAPLVYGATSEPCSEILKLNPKAKCEDDYTLASDFVTAAGEIEDGILTHGPENGLTVAVLEYDPAANMKDCFGQALQVAGPLYDDFEDTAIWTGHCLAAEAFRYAAAAAGTTEQKKADERVTQLLTGIQRLFDVPQHYTLHGQPLLGLFCRAALPDRGGELAKTNPNFSKPCRGDGSYYDQPVPINGVDWYGFGRDDSPVSRDQYVGIVLGLFFTGRFLPPGSTQKTQADALLLSLVDYLNANSWTSPTPRGDLNGHWTNYPINQFATDWHMRLAFLRAAKEAEANPCGPHAQAYKEAAAALAPHLWIPGWADTFDPTGHYQKFNLHLGALLVLMYANSGDAHYADYQTALNLLREFLKNHRNAHFNLVWAFCQEHPAAALAENPSGFGDPHLSVADETKALLMAWVSRWKQVLGPHQLPKQATSRDAKEYLAGAQAVAKTTPYAVRPDLRPGGGLNFMWERHPFSTDPADQKPSKESAGVDFLLPYYMARQAGLMLTPAQARGGTHRLPAAGPDTTPLDRELRQLNHWFEQFLTFASISITHLKISKSPPIGPKLAGAALCTFLNAQNVDAYLTTVSNAQPYAFDILKGGQLYLSQSVTFLDYFTRAFRGGENGPTGLFVADVVKFWADVHSPPPPSAESWENIPTVQILHYPVGDILTDDSAIGSFAGKLVSGLPALIGSDRLPWDQTGQVAPCFSPSVTIGDAINRLLNQK